MCPDIQNENARKTSTGASERSVSSRASNQRRMWCSRAVDDHVEIRVAERTSSGHPSANSWMIAEPRLTPAKWAGPRSRCSTRPTTSSAKVPTE